MNLTFWIIRHKPSGTFLPARVRSTAYDFDRPIGTYEPRLFKSKRAAMCCATCWSQGVWTADTRTESEGWEYPSYTIQDLPSPTSVPGRSRDQLEVLQCVLAIDLTVVDPT